MTDIEDVIEKMIEILKAELPAEIIAMNTEKGDSFVLDEIGEVYFGDRVVDMVVRDNPVMMVMKARMDAEPEGGFSDEREMILVSCAMRSDFGEELQRKLLRYGRIIKKILKGNKIVELLEFVECKDSAVIEDYFSPIDRVGAKLYQSINVGLVVLMID